ncbi:phage-related baseplate assembly protein V [Pseudovibrio sp. FO-BEG1]|uniref:phage baseplate assembly protein V n=1 Tax=Pseudovibrio sp. (strain FO-BEG1) TaxID=911045 RepID=UPI000238D396|nr:phage baseplate assembly protein V [Pseudovibrio sp. FO-BEG1]AEV37554.1 phage-related baseplate assembly protein V [Pseudovibrio sp. FO-BEG1]
MAQDMPDLFAELHFEVAEIKRRLASRTREGVIAEVDAARGKARVRLTDSDSPMLTGWLPWTEPASGANKTHNPPSVGQQVTINSESGDLTDARIGAALPSEGNPRPSAKGDDYVLAQVGATKVIVSGGGEQLKLSVGNAAITLVDGQMTFSVAGTSITLSPSGITTAGDVDLNGGYVKSEGTTIDHTHIHSGVTPGPSNTGTPV